MNTTSIIILIIGIVLTIYSAIFRRKSKKCQRCTQNILRPKDIKCKDYIKQCKICSYDLILPGTAMIVAPLIYMFVEWLYHHLVWVS